MWHSPFFLNILGDIRLLFKDFMRYCEPSQLRSIFNRGMHACLEFVRKFKKLLPKFVLKKKKIVFSQIEYHLYIWQVGTIQRKCIQPKCKDFHCVPRRRAQMDAQSKNLDQRFGNSKFQRFY